MKGLWSAWDSYRPLLQVKNERRCHAMAMDRESLWISFFKPMESWIQLIRAHKSWKHGFRKWKDLSRGTVWDREIAMRASAGVRAALMERIDYVLASNLWPLDRASVDPQRVYCWPHK